MILTKETLDSWYEPKKVTSGLTEKEEAVVEDVEESVCDICNGTGEVETRYRGDDTGYNWVADDVKPCLCQLSDEEDNF